MRILIAGGPCCGKTTTAQMLATHLHLPYRSTDDLIGTLEWSETSEEVATWFAEDYLIIEGVVVPRALRKYFRDHDEPPADYVLWLEHPYGILTKGQQAMLCSCRNVFHQVLGNLHDLDVPVFLLASGLLRHVKGAPARDIDRLLPRPEPPPVVPPIPEPEAEDPVKRAEKHFDRMMRSAEEGLW